MMPVIPQRPTTYLSEEEFYALGVSSPNRFIALSVRALQIVSAWLPLQLARARSTRLDHHQPGGHQHRHGADQPPGQPAL